MVAGKCFVGNEKLAFGGDIDLIQVWLNNILSQYIETNILASQIKLHLLTEIFLVNLMFHLSSQGSQSIPNIILGGVEHLFASNNKES